MRLLKTIGVLLLAVGFTAGCGRYLTEDSDPGEDVRPPGKPKGPVALVPLKASLDGVIRGQLVYDGGSTPTPDPIDAMKNHGDRATCLAGSESETTTQVWRVDPATKGVANAVVYLKPPTGKYFELTEAVRTPTTKLKKLHQPHCAFIPHIITVFPKYFDGKDYQNTGQELEIVNDAPISHNVRYEGDKNGTLSKVITPNSSFTVTLLPEKNPLNVSCQFHSWMSAKIWPFDNPFHAVTDEKGNFEIKNVPTGVPVQFVAWHEAKGNFVTETKTFTKGANPAMMLKISR